MKKFTTLFWCAVFLFPSCNNPYVQDLLYGPAVADNLSILADDGAAYALEQNPRNEREYTVTVPAMTEAFTVRGFARNGGSVAYSYTATQPGAVAGDRFAYSYSGAFSPESPSGYIKFIPGKNPGQYLETIVVKVRVTQRYMEESVNTVVVHRGIDTMLWNFKLEQGNSAANTPLTSVRSFPSYDKTRLYNGTKNSSSLVAPEDSKHFAFLVSPETDVVRFNAFLRGNTRIQYAASAGYPDADPEYGDIFTTERADAYAVELSNWDSGTKPYLYIRVWYAGLDLNNPNPPPPNGPADLVYEEYAFKIQERPAFMFDASDPSNPGLEFALTGHDASDPAVGHFEPESLLVFSITPPVGIKVSFLMYESYSGGDITDDDNWKQIALVPAGSSTTYSYIMPSYDPDDTYEKIRVKTTWTWDDGNFSGNLPPPNVRLVRPGDPAGSPYTPDGAPVLPSGINPEDANPADYRIFGDATTWGTATSDLQGLIDAWTADCDWNEIWIAAGTYTPYWAWAADGNYDDAPVWNGVLAENAGYDFNQRYCWSFFLRGGVNIYGGFAGNETERSGGRDIAGNETILSGAISSSVNAVHVVVAKGIVTGTILEGVTITGSADGPYSYEFKIDDIEEGSPSDYGNMAEGSVFIDSCGDEASPNAASLKLNRVTIRDNSHLAGGGAVINQSYGVEFSGCAITGNSATIGGGLFVQTASFTCTDTDISNNLASFYGGGIASMEGDGKFSGGAISGNRSSVAAGGIFMDRGSMEFDPAARTAISGNRASESIGGGGIFAMLPVDGSGLAATPWVVNTDDPYSPKFDVAPTDVAGVIFSDNSPDNMQISL
ncbi:MAG: right-handed parallel beta-helix repeat-containing protein [Spirochaetaceae bacterium]|jgi:hypothetical protein|nr:right-handed parallel beta-helix repeat-containing protein [Spirochaetaceae bacterium]